MAYSDSRRKSRGSNNKGTEDDNDEEEISELSPLELIRFALNQLENISNTEILDNPNAIPRVSSLLLVCDCKL